MTNPCRSKMNCAVVFFCVATAVAAQAQTLTTIQNFDSSNGAEPEYTSITQGVDGNLYGSTSQGGSDLVGTVFKISPANQVSLVYSFDVTDGELPYGGPVQATNGTLYGTTTYGGANGAGSIYEFPPGGQLTTLYSFCSKANCADGERPWGSLIEATNGDLYGTTFTGGAYDSGTVFKITPTKGKLTTLYNFCTLQGCADGVAPYSGLVQASNGNLYGTTSSGGANNRGTVFEITPTKGKLTTVYSFCQKTNCTDGAGPYGGLIQASNGNFYGTTYKGGVNCVSDDGCGTVFEIPTKGMLKTLYNFCTQSNCADGANPQVGLVQATDGKLYGTTWLGGANGDGTIFSITTKGAPNTLVTFDGSNGNQPWGVLFQATNGTLYGSTFMGGSDGYGTVFSLSVGLGPFVETLPTAGKVGTQVLILGDSLTGTTEVTFNGTAAQFTVVSGTEIKATVPTGATSGTVEVTTPNGTLKSNVIFRVTK